MIFGEITRMAMGSLRGHRLRSFLTIAGVTVGVFSVIGVMTVVGALRSSIETGLGFLGANSFLITKRPQGISFSGVDWSKIQRRPNFTSDQAERYRALMDGWSDLICLTVYDDDDVRASANGRQTNPGISYGGTNEHFLAMEQYEIEAGRNFTPLDVDSRNPVAIIGHTLVERLFPSESPLGQTIKIGVHAYTVIGTLAHKGASFGQSEDEVAMVPVSRFLEDNGAANYSLDITTQAASQAALMATMEQAITAMRSARGLLPDQDNDFEVSTNDTLIAAFASVADTVSEGALVISAIALVAAGIGIMNIMLVSVTERTKEIGVRRSIGARRIHLLAQFLMEAIAMSLAGGLAGVLLGAAVGDGVALLLHVTPVFPWAWALIGMLVCSGIGVGFGFYPALRAARMDPIAALRYE
jgi:putative ABC transport system permease protein